jgi:hypothetical protein
MPSKKSQTTDLITVADLDAAIIAGKQAARDFMATNPEDKADWFPCGLAWVTYRCWKNAKEAATLTAHGFKWNDYQKQYELTAYEFTMTQSMNRQSAILRNVSEKIRAAGFDAYVRTYVD